MEPCAQIFVAIEALHCVQALVDATDIRQGHDQPPPEHPRPHGRSGSVDGLGQRSAVVVVGLDEFEVADGEPVHPQGAVFAQGANRSNVLGPVVLGVVEVVKNRPCREQSQGPCIELKPLEGFVVELLLDALLGIIRFEHPIVQPAEVPVAAESFGKCRGLVFQHQHLRGLVCPKQPVDECFIAFSRGKVAGRNIEEGEAIAGLVAVHGCEVVVGPDIEYLVVKSDPRGDQFRDTALDDANGLFRVFELITNGNAMARSHQPWQVGVQRVVGKASEFYFARTSVSPFCQYDVQDIGRFDGVVSKGFVEIAHPKKEQRFRIIGFDPIVLLHKGCRFLGHGA